MAGQGIPDPDERRRPLPTRSVTTDHFGFDPGRRAELESRLSALGDVEVPEPGDRDDPYRFVRPGGPLGGPDSTTSLGTVWFAEAGLRLETNSVERADRLRARLEAIGGGLLRHRAREHSSPFAPPGPEARRAPTRDPEPLEEVAKAVKELLDRHYADWPDHPLPALGGLSPRQAVRGHEGRERVLALIKSFEHSAARGQASQAPDTARLRRELGLES